MLKFPKIFRCLSLVLVLLLVLWQFPVVTAADETLILPEEFYGNITINNINAPEGTEITAKIGGVKKGSLTLTEEGRYGGIETFDTRLIVEGQQSGEEITFWVDGVSANQKVEFEPGISQELDLTFTVYPLNPGDIQIEKALNFLKDSQNSQGKIYSYVASSWAVMAIVAAGEDPHDFSSGGESVVDYLRDNADGNLDTTIATDLERSILAIVAAGENPSSFGDLDYIGSLFELFDGTQMDEDALVNDDIWALPVLQALGTNPEAAESITDFVIDNQNSDGGWSWAVGGESDADNTAAAISALLRMGISKNDKIIKDALEYLKTQQQNNGGFISEGSANSGVDAWVIRAIRDAGQDPAGEDWRIGENNPVSHLLGLQDEDGAFKWTSSTRTNAEWMTAYAVTALLGPDWPEDETDPEITMIKPASGSKTSSTSPEIEAGFSDSISGIDLSSVRIWLDSTEIEDPVIGENSVSYQTKSLSRSDHTVKVSVSDKKGNQTDKTWSFKVTKSSGGGGGGGGGTKTTPTPTPTPTPTSVLAPEDFPEASPQPVLPAVENSTPSGQPGVDPEIDNRSVSAPVDNQSSIENSLKNNPSGSKTNELLTTSTGTKSGQTDVPEKTDPVKTESQNWLIFGAIGAGILIVIVVLGILIRTRKSK